jgi:hypothetical protein
MCVRAGIHNSYAGSDGPFTPPLPGELILPHSEREQACWRDSAGDAWHEAGTGGPGGGWGRSIPRKTCVIHGGEGEL